jgi:uncharacterized protein YbcI
MKRIRVDNYDELKIEAKKSGEACVKKKAETEAKKQATQQAKSETKRAKADAVIAANAAVDAAKEVVIKSNDVAAFDARVKKEAEIEAAKEAKQTIKRARAEVAQEAHKESKQTIERARTEATTALEAAKQVEAESNETAAADARVRKKAEAEAAKDAKQTIKRARAEVAQEADNEAKQIMLSCGSEGCGRRNNGTFLCASSAKMKLHKRTKKHQVREKLDIRA